MGQLQREYFEALGRGLVSYVEVGCAGKTAYRAFEADRVLKGISKRGVDRRGDKMGAYHCFYCGMWHLGSRREASPATFASIRRKKAFTPKS